MRLPTLALVLAVAAATTATPIFAQTSAAAAAPTLREGMAIVTSEGARVGRIMRVFADANGQSSAVSVIYRGQIIRIPVSTLTTDGRRATTSLTPAELRAL